MYQSVFTRHMFKTDVFSLLVMLTYFASNAEGSFASEMFRLVAKGHRLSNSLIYEEEIYSVMDCAHLCLSEHPQCKSINFENGKKQNGGRRHKCQLNNETKTIAPKKLVPNSAFNYYEPIKVTYRNGEDHETQGRSCSDLYQKGARKDGVYKIDPDGLGAFNVSCDMTTGGGGWTVFQRRKDGSVEFYLGWDDYKKGFGNPNGELWLGLDKIHRLTKSGQNVLRVDLEDFENETRYAEYLTFAVANETDKYNLTVGNYSGNAGDSLTYHNGMSFTTKDRDNDRKKDKNCATTGAWWYRSCFYSNLNGLYLRGVLNGYGGASWYYWKSNRYSFKTTEMKIRPRSF